MNVSEQLHVPAALRLGKEPPVPIGKECVPQNLSGRCGEEKHLNHAGNRTPASQSVGSPSTDSNIVCSIYFFVLLDRKFRYL